MSRRTILVSSKDIESSVPIKITKVKEIIKKIKVPVYSKNCDSEIAKIEEYYEKAFSLFLSKIGVRQNLKELLSNPEDSAERFKKDAIETKPKKIDILKTADFDEYFVEHIKDSALVKHSKSSRLKDPILFYARAKYVQSFRKIDKLNGQFSGELYHISEIKRQ